YIFSDVYELLFFDDGGERALLRLNADDAFLSALSAYVQPAEKSADADGEAMSESVDHTEK
ncbi:MAG: hypothetical protein J6W28_08860, partial [Clostridia bacterium]|nr:hypothetical protein [Clostridia bacterium]